MIHRESSQLLIANYVVDAEGGVRVIPIGQMPIRITAIARHLSDPANMAYYVDMEGATSTLVLLAGFGAASQSSIPTTQEFSRLASLAVATALVADVNLLPALLSWHGPRRSSS